MERILIIGCSGSGKSTLARALGEKLDIPVVHLDQLWWKEGWENVTREEFDSRLAMAMNGDQWIIDGNYSRTIGLIRSLSSGSGISTRTTGFGITPGWPRPSTRSPSC